MLYNVCEENLAEVRGMEKNELLRRARKNKNNEFETRLKNRYIFFMYLVFALIIAGVAFYLNHIGLVFQSYILIVIVDFLVFVGMPLYFYSATKEKGYLLAALIGFMLFCLPILVKIFNLISM